MTFFRSIRLLVVAAALTVTGSAWGQSQPAAPATTLPAGHPPMSSGGAMGGVPGSHLNMEQLLGGAATQGGAGGGASNLTGVVNVTVVAAGPNASSTANEPVTVEFMHRGSPLKKLDLKTDGLGKLNVPDVPLMPPVEVELSITHAGIVQRATAPDVSMDAPVQSFEWKVYETTEQEPAWTIPMQHMIVQWGPEGKSIVVTEMLSTNNPGDWAWIGNKSADGNRRITMTLPLPPNADEIELGGFDEEATNLVDGKLVTSSPVPPGSSKFRMSYVVPVKDGNLDLLLAFPRAVDNFIMFLPADDTQIKATGLNDGGAVDMGGGGGGKLRMFRAQALAAGASASLSIKGIKAAPVVAEDETSPAKSQLSARNVAVGGAFLMVLVGAALMLMKKPQPRKD